MICYNESLAAAKGETRTSKQSQNRTENTTTTTTKCGTDGVLCNEPNSMPVKIESV